MAIAYFPSLEQADTLDVIFSKPNGGEVPLRLLVDSGFTGGSCFVLPEGAVDLEHAPAPDSQFRRWGAERIDDGSWRVFLETDAI